MPTPDGFRVTQTPPGGEPVALGKQLTSATWTSSIPGGFGSANIVIPRALTQKERGLLGPLTIEYEGRVLFDGRVEDDILRWAKTSVATELQAFGYQRLLTDCSVRRAWSMRTSLSPQVSPSGKGSSSVGAIALNQDSVNYVFGRYDSSNPTKFGVRISLTNSATAGQAGQVGIALPSGLTGARILFDVILSTSSLPINVHSTADGVTYTRAIEQGTSGSIDVALVKGATEIRLAMVNTSGITLTGDPAGASFYAEISNIRVLGTNLREDSAGGFYGGTILRDVIASCPGLYPGTIEDGSDFVIAEINRVNRTEALDVVKQIEPLYAREWGVWEAGRFDWITPDLKTGGWVIPLTQTSEGQIERSIDTLHKRTYVTFQDAADQQFKEASSESANARNPYVRLGMQKDGVVAAPAAMTNITAPLLAAKLNNDFGRWPDIKGSVTLLAGTMIDSASGSQAVPAFAIRAGDNITIPDLPVEDIYAAGQDGQTVFHVTGVQSGTDGNVVLALEGLTRRADVLLARLGNVSQ